MCLVAGHWQNKPYPYAPYQGRTLGDGTLLSLDMSTDYYWCWIGIGVNLAYILLLNGIIVLCLAFLPAYGSNATIAKTFEELEDRRAALYGEQGTDASHIVVNVQTPSEMIQVMLQGTSYVYQVTHWTVVLFVWGNGMRSRWHGSENTPLSWTWQ